MADETIERTRRELAVMEKMTAALEAVDSDAKRLRILAAVAAIYGHDDIAIEMLNAARAREAQEGAQAAKGGE